MPVTKIGSRWANGELEFFDKANPARILHRIATTRVQQVRSANATLAVADSGKLTLVDTDAVVLTLPATLAGLTFTIVNIGADGAVQVSLSPNAIDAIQGVDLTVTDNKDLINTKATAKRGDMVTIVGDGTVGWVVQEIVGTWAREA